MADRVIHFEIPADDFERAKAFYEQAFGWRITPFPGHDYLSLETTPSDEQGAPASPGGINGGMMLRKEPATAPVVFMEVADIDASLRTIEELGGSVALGKTPVGEMGFFAYFQDSEGNVMGLWESAAPGEPAGS
jgi:predicted enzyme related to lactoylglutathione lyase